MKKSKKEALKARFDSLSQELQELREAQKKKIWRDPVKRSTYFEKWYEKQKQENLELARRIAAREVPNRHGNLKPYKQ